MESVKRMSCEEAVRQFYAYLDRALAGEPHDALEDHLKACLECCEKLEFSRKLDAFVRGRLWDTPLPEGIEQKIRRTLCG
jgi:anti-sigma factor (TIGR02949 family)